MVHITRSIGYWGKVKLFFSFFRLISCIYTTDSVSKTTYLLGQLRISQVQKRRIVDNLSSDPLSNKRRCPQTDTGFRRLYI